MMEVDALPHEDVQEAAPTSGGSGEEEVEKEGDEEAGAEEEEWIDWGPPRRNAFDEDSDPDYDPSNP